MEEAYTTKFGTGTDVRSLGWGSTASQETRFRVLLEINTLNPSESVLDVGCGYADLYPLVSNYTGIDIRPRAIEEASRRYPDARLLVGTVEDITDSFDWVFASGIFAFDRPDWSTDTHQTLTSMYRLCKKGVAINVLSSLTPNSKDPSMKYVTPAEILALVSQITTRFTLRHGYLANDMTVYLYK